jgi:hypothetical protein
MSLSDQHKEAVRSWVPRLRRTLEKHFEEVQLSRLGLKPNGKHTPLDKMSLADDDVAVRRRTGERPENTAASATSCPCHAGRAEKSDRQEL